MGLGNWAIVGFTFIKLIHSSFMLLLKIQHEFIKSKQDRPVIQTFIQVFTHPKSIISHLNLSFNSNSTLIIQLFLPYCLLSHSSFNEHSNRFPYKFITINSCTFYKYQCWNLNQIQFPNQPMFHSNNFTFITCSKKYLNSIYKSNL